MPYSLFLIPLLFQFTCPSRSTTGRLYNVMRELLFQFTCPSRSTTTQLSLWHSWPEFQFTCPSRSTTLDFTGLSHFFGVSIHVPLAEHDAPRRAHNLPTLVSIHVPLAEHDCGGCQPLEPVSVSIHVPLAEHDKTSCPARPSSTSFNSRAPRDRKSTRLNSSHRL